MQFRDAVQSRFGKRQRTVEIRMVTSAHMLLRRLHTSCMGPRARPTHGHSECVSSSSFCGLLRDAASRQYLVLAVSFCLLDALLGISAERSTQFVVQTLSPG